MLRSRLLRRVSLLLGSTIGASSCVTYDYGAMMVGYDLSGSVVDAATGDAIPGIRVDYQSGSTSSEPDGTWQLFAPAGDDCAAVPCTATATDVDGQNNGAYLDGEASFSTELDEDGEGGGTATDIIIELEQAPTDTGNSG